VLAFLRWAENPRDRVAGCRVIQLLPGAAPATAARILDRGRTERPNPRIERWQPVGNWVVSAANFGSERELSRRRCGARRTDSGVVQIQSQLPVFTQGVPAYDVLVAADESDPFCRTGPGKLFTQDQTGKILYVANENDNTVTIIDLERRDIGHIDHISDEMRAVVESEWPELAHKLPPQKPQG
jgi:hypothetical protein